MIFRLVHTRVKAGKDTCEPRNQAAYRSTAVTYGHEVNQIVFTDLSARHGTRYVPLTRSWKRDRGRAIHNIRRTI